MHTVISHEGYVMNVTLHGSCRCCVPVWINNAESPI